MRLRRSDPNRPGYTRHRRGRGFSYHDRTGAAVTDPAELARIRALAVPPAWRDVWISEYLGNTPAIARASYVDPRVFDQFCDGVTIAETLADLGGAPDLDDPGARRTVEAAVLAMVRIPHG